MGKDIVDEILFNGGLDSDSDDKFIKQGDYVDALNIAKVEDGDEGIVVNVKGNRSVYTKDVGDLREYLCGWCVYNKNETIILFLYTTKSTSPFTYNKIVEFNPQTEASTVIINDLLLGFSNPSTSDYYIKADMIDDWLAWTDNLNEPCMINVQNTKDGVATANSSYLHLIKAPPLEQSSVSLEQDTDYASNKIFNRFFQFKSQYVFDDFRKTVWSVASDVSVDKYNSSYNERYDEAYAQNYIFVSFNSGDTNVGSVNVAVKAHYDDNWYLVNIINKENPVEIYDASKVLITTALSNDTTYYFKFYNDSSYNAIDVNEILQPYDAVPLKSETVSAIGENRIILGGNTEGFDLITPDVTITPYYHDQDDYVTNMATSFSSSSTFGVNLTISFTIPNGDYPAGTTISMAGTYLHRDTGGIDRLMTVQDTIVLNQDYNVPADNAALNTFFSAIAKNAATTPEASDTYGSYASSKFSYTAFWASIYILGTDTSKIAYGTILDGDSMSKSFKRGKYYKAGLIYYDAFGRKLPVITSDDFRTYIKQYYEHSDNTERGVVELEWSISHSAPLAAKHYRWAYVKDNYSFFYARAKEFSEFKNDDDTNNEYLIAVNFYESDSGYVTGDNDYLDKYTIEKGDFISPVGYLGYDSGTSGTYFDKKRSFKVVDVKLSIKDTAGDSKTGYWVLIKPTTEDRWDGESDSFFGSCTYEITKDINADSIGEKLFFEVGDLYTCNNGTHSQTTGTNANGHSIVQGDVYTRFRNVGDSYYRFFYNEDVYPSDNTNYLAYDFDLPNVVYKESKEKYNNTIRISNKYFQDTQVNGLSSFDLIDTATTQAKIDISDNYGKIKGLEELGNSLVIICEEKILSAFVGATEYTDTQGNVNVVKSTRALGYARPHAEKYGTFLKESILNTGKYIYFYDLFNGVVIRKSANGLFPISGKISTGQGTYNYNMRSYFKALSESLIESLYVNEQYYDVKCYMGFDPYYENIYITFKDNETTANNVSLVFSETTNKWVTKYTSYVAGESSTIQPFTKNSLFSYYGNSLYKLNDSSVNRCMLYGEQQESYIQFTTHSATNIIKVFNSIGIHADSQWTVESIESDSNSNYINGFYSKIPDVNFVQEEGVWRSEFLRNMKTRSSTPTNYDLNNGEECRNYVVKIKLTNDEIVKTELFKVDISSIISK